VFLLIFKRSFIKEERTLAALKFYCGQSLENAHSQRILWQPYEILHSWYPDLQNDIKSLSEFSTRKKADFGNDAFEGEGKNFFFFEKKKKKKKIKFRNRTWLF
jgi:DNA polymerase-3 subunit epsilon